MNVVQIVLAGERADMADRLVPIPVFGGTYSGTELAAMANYVTARFGTALPHLTAKDVARLRQLSSN